MRNGPQIDCDCKEEKNCITPFNSNIAIAILTYIATLILSNIVQWRLTRQIQNDK